MRRTFASYLISDPNRTIDDKQITISDVSRLLGHKNIEITIKYLFNIVNLVDFDKIRTAISRMHD